MGITRVYSGQADVNRVTLFSIFTPRIWKIMVVVAYPFLLLATNYFETLERTGAMGAFIADTFLPATTISYVVLILVLKKRVI